MPLADAFIAATVFNIVHMALFPGAADPCVKRGSADRVAHALTHVRPERVTLPDSR